MKARYELDLFEVVRSTSRRTDMTLLVMDREDGKALTKFKKIPVAFLIGEDGSITLLSNHPIKVTQFGTPDSD